MNVVHFLVCEKKFKLCHKMTGSDISLLDKMNSLKNVL